MINERFALVRKALNLTTRKFGEKINITGGAVTNIEKGKRNITDRVIYDVCREFNVNEDWLRNDIGEMFKEEDTFSLDDYLNFKDDEILEIINGIIAMPPAPSRIHQKIIMKIAYKLENYININNGSCEVYPAPFDVVLVKEKENELSSKNIVQPDISVICDKNKLTEKGCTGSPDMIVEVVSAFNPQNDYVKKLNLYQEYKVKEYWIVNPMKKNILVYTLTENGYGMPNIYTFNDKVKVNIFKNLDIDFGTIDI